MREESPGPGRVGGEEEGERLSGEAEIVTGEEGGPVRPGGVSYSIVIVNVIFNLIVIIVIIITINAIIILILILVLISSSTI